jgi:hypothetical protein
MGDDTARPNAAVLVVDDDLAKRIAMRAMLAPLGLEASKPTRAGPRWPPSRRRPSR